MPAILITILVLIVLTLLYFAIGFYSAIKVIAPPKRDYQAVLASERTDGSFNEALLELPFERFERTNAQNYKLVARLYRCETPSTKYILFNHGYNYPWISVLKYLPMLLDFGYNVLVPDHASEGESQGKYITFGYYESKDSMEWVNFIYQIAAKTGVQNPRIGVMGESMGATTALLMAEQDRRLRFCIADCPYGSWDDVLHDRARKDLGFWTPPFIPAVRIAIRLLSGAHVREVDAVTHAADCSIPVLILHGDADDYVPAAFSKKVADHNTRIEYQLIKGAKHAQSIKIDEENYRRIVLQFLQRNGL